MRVLVFAFFLVLVLLAVALISALSAEKGEVRNLPRGLWVAAILLLPLVGPALYLWLGRPARVSATAAERPRTASRPKAPDDDPDFLRRLRASGPPPVADPWSGTDFRPGQDSRTKEERPPTDG